MQVSEDESEEAALARLIEAEPHSVAAHVRLGDLSARAGKEQLARFYYRRALRFAECQDLPDETKREVSRAEAALGALEGRAHAEREALLIERGHPPDQWSPRLRQALEIAAGRRKPYASEPTAFDYTGLPAIQYFDPTDFSWVPALEATTAAIRSELLRELEREKDEFRAYVQGHPVVLDPHSTLVGNTDWSFLALCQNGWVATEVVQRFPRTWQAVRRTSLAGIFGWGPTVLFSKLKAGAHIPAHTGMFNTRLTCHLPLIVPPGCRFRVGNEIREWEEGKLLIFDDTIEHEAWNDSDKDRVVLIFDIWRPELTDQEKEELTALFHA
jgi:aspartyl/asparaginyl beta-hydroxylase (cupin superfamily)